MTIVQNQIADDDEVEQKEEEEVVEENADNKPKVAVAAAAVPVYSHDLSDEAKANVHYSNIAALNDTGTHYLCLYLFLFLLLLGQKTTFLVWWISCFAFVVNDKMSARVFICLPCVWL